MNKRNLFIASFVLMTIIVLRFVMPSQAGGGGFVSYFTQPTLNSFLLSVDTGFENEQIDYDLLYMRSFEGSFVQDGVIGSGFTDNTTNLVRTLYTGTCSTSSCITHPISHGTLIVGMPRIDYYKIDVFNMNAAGYKQTLLQCYIWGKPTAVAQTWLDDPTTENLNAIQNTCSTVLTGTVTPTMTATPTATNTPMPTATPTSTPTPTPAPVPFEQIGLKPIAPVELTVQQGITTYTPAGIVESISAYQITNYGYPTSYGAGISMQPSSGGILPGQKTDLRLFVNGNVPTGTYSGYQRIHTGNSTIYSVYPVTVHVVETVPTATPTPTATKTPTPTPVPDLTFSNVKAVSITKTAATITWNTNVPATSQVAYSASKRSMYQTPESSTLVTTHSVSLTGLSGGKTYNYYVISKDQNGVTKVSAVLKFTTPRK